MTASRHQLERLPLVEEEEAEADVAEDAEERGEHDEGREAHDAPLGRSELGGAGRLQPCLWEL